MPETRSSQRRRTGPGPGSGPDSDVEMEGRDGGLRQLFDGFRAEMESAIAAIVAKFEEVIRRELAAIEESVDIVCGRVADVEQQVAAAAQSAAAAARAEVQAGVAALSDRVAGLERRVEGQDQASRLCSLVLHGVVDGGRSEPTKDKVRGLLRDVAPADVLEARRLGRPAPGRARPVLVRFSSVQAKHEAWRSAKTLRAAKIFVDEDLTAAQRGRRQELRARYAERRDKGWKPFWRGDRLMYADGDRLAEDTGCGAIGLGPGLRTPPAPPSRAPSSCRVPGGQPVQRPHAAPAAPSAGGAPARQRPVSPARPTPPSPTAAQEPPSAARPPPPPTFAAAVASGSAATSGVGSGPSPSAPAARP